MSARESDVVVYGATGFTGSRVLRTLLSLAPEGTRVTAGGRDRSRLVEVVKGLGAETTYINDSARLLDMAKSTRLVLNCVGPYRFWGESVVTACIEGGAHYLDVCGEPEFIEKIAYSYDEAAKASGVMIASAAGFDSVPADLGTLFTVSQFAHPSSISSIDSFLTLHTGPAGFMGHYPTWQCAVLGFAAGGELKALRAKAKADGKVPPQPTIPGPPPQRISGPNYSKTLKAYGLPFMGADASIVRRTQAAVGALGGAASHYSAMFTVQSKWNVFLFGIFGTVFKQLAGSGWGRQLLLR